MASGQDPSVSDGVCKVTGECVEGANEEGGRDAGACGHFSKGRNCESRTLDTRWGKGQVSGGCTPGREGSQPLEGRAGGITQSKLREGLGRGLGSQACRAFAGGRTMGRAT